MDDDSTTTDGSIDREVPGLSSLLGHFYRGEMDRVTSWSGRLDRTTNWAVTIMAAIITWAFTSPDNPPYILLFGMGTVGVFHLIETRRYRTYDIWRSRVRLLEENVFAELLTGEVESTGFDWRLELAKDLRQPAVKIPFLEAYGRRLRRVYLPLLFVLLLAWVARITVFSPGQTAVEAAGVVGVPGELVIGAVAAAYLAWTAIALWPRERQAKGEQYDRDEFGEWKDD